MTGPELQDDPPRTVVIDERNDATNRSSKRRHDPLLRPHASATTIDSPESPA